MNLPGKERPLIVGKNIEVAVCMCDMQVESLKGQVSEYASQVEKLEVSRECSQHGGDCSCVGQAPGSMDQPAATGAAALS